MGLCDGVLYHDGTCVAVPKQPPGRGAADPPHSPFNFNSNSGSSFPVYFYSTEHLPSFSSVSLR